MRKLFISLSACTFLAVCANATAEAQASSGARGQQVTIPGKRPPMEPGRVFAGNDQGVLEQLRGLVARSDAETDKVIAELEGYGLDKLSPIILLEYSRRLKLKGNADWRYWYELGSARAKYDQRACKDGTAPQFVTVAGMEFYGALGDRDKSFKDAVMANDDDRYRILRRILDSGAMFKSEASAWYVCSHGMANMTAAMSGRTMSLNDWWVGQPKLDEERKKAEQALGQLLKEKGF